MVNERLMLLEYEKIKSPSGISIVSIFWMTETKARAKRFAHMEKIGLITRKREHPQDAYPNCVFEITS